MDARSGSIGRRATAIVLAAIVLATSARGGVMDQPEAASPPGPVPTRAAWLWVGFAEVLTFAQDVGTIVVGNADVLIASVVDETTVVLTALSAGRTNVVVLGQEGAVLSRLSVVVRAPRQPTTEVYRGTERTLLVCDPDCRPAAAPVPEEPAE